MVLVLPDETTHSVLTTLPVGMQDIEDESIMTAAHNSVLPAELQHLFAVGS